MRIHLMSVVACVAACSAPLPELVTTPTPGLASLDLRGQYETGVEGTIATLPLSGARVELVGVGLVTHTDAYGEFSFLGIPVEALSHRLEFLVFDAQALESDPPIGRFVETISSTAVGSVTFTKKVVNPRGAVTGRVDLVGDDNDGGVLVYAEGFPGVDDLTGPDGSFVLLGIPAGSVQIRSNREGFLPSPEVVDFEAQAYLQRTLDNPIILNPVPGQPATAITGGRVLTVDGTIPDGTEVWAIPQISGGVGQAMVRMPVSSDGRFGAALHFPEPHQFVLKSGGQLTAARRLHVQPGRQDLVLVGLPLGDREEDRDGDGRVGAEDVDDTDPHTWSDLDGDGLGDIHDWDDDGDEVADMEELCPGRDNQTSDPEEADTGAFRGNPGDDVTVRLAGGEGHFWGNGRALLSEITDPTAGFLEPFQVRLDKRRDDFGTRLLHGPYRIAPVEGGRLEFRAFGYLGNADDTIEAVTMPAELCDEWSERRCSPAFGDLNISASGQGIAQHPLTLSPTGRGRFKIQMPLELTEPTLIWVWLPGGGAITPLCGNGTVDAGEVCDDGNDQEDDDCTTVCRRPTCGDGLMQPGLEEGCDDGNGDPSDACTNQCQPARCGDGILRTGLTEDDPGYEACDDGNADDGDGCDAECALEAGGECIDADGDQHGEGCENGPDCNDNEASLQDNCDECGNGVLEVRAGESCDDGNQADGDGCSSNCRVEEAQQCVDPDGDGFGHGCANGPDCNEQNPEQHDDCDRCGNGFVEDGETCDDGNVVANDGCDPDCQLEQACGNDVIEGDEFCDDGNTRDGDGCASDCSSPVLVPLSVGASYSCRVGDGSQPAPISCWGQLFGDGGQPDSSPVVKSEWPVHQVSLGGDHGCVIRAGGGQNGQVYCFGINLQRQLGQSGQGGRDLGNLPLYAEHMEEPMVATKVASGANHSCALTPAGDVYCWGANDEGQSGQFDGDGEPSPASNVPVPTGVDLNGEAVDIAVGANHSCALMRSGVMKCWGFAETNALGRPAAGQDACAGRTDERTVGEVEGLPENDAVHMMTGGAAHTCTLMVSGSIYCWGDDSSGALGHGQGGCQTDPVPQPVTMDTGWEQIAHFSHVSAGNELTCALGWWDQDANAENNDEDFAWCWGSNQSGQLGVAIDDPDLAVDVPWAVGGAENRLLHTTFLATGLGFHACAITLPNPGAETSCWGMSNAYQVGNCQLASVDRPASVTEVACGF